MPELPDVLLYCDALRRFTVGRNIIGVSLKSPFLVRSFDPPLEDVIGRWVHEVNHLGKRLLIELQPELYVVIHLMIAGRFQWKKPGVKPKAKKELLAIGFDEGTLMLTEEGHKHRASLHVERTREAALAHDPGGIDVLACSFDRFQERLVAENRTLKRALTNPRMFSGIGNAYSDEILLDARLSPVKLTQRLTTEEQLQLYESTQRVLREWIERLKFQTGNQFPKRVTAFRPEMAAHGKYGQPCPNCDKPILRIVYADNETNYCAQCQNDGRVLADRSLSRLLKEDWPRDIESWET